MESNFTWLLGYFFHHANLGDSFTDKDHSKSHVHCKKTNDVDFPEIQVKPLWLPFCWNLWHGRNSVEVDRTVWKRMTIWMNPKLQALRPVKSNWWQGKSTHFAHVAYLVRNRFATVNTKAPNFHLTFLKRRSLKQLIFALAKRREMNPIVMERTKN